MSQVEIFEAAQYTDEVVRARYAETDQMGHVYYANYLIWMEIGRGAWCRARGYSYNDIESMGFFTPVVEVSIKYSREIKYDTEVIVRTKLTEMRRASFKYEYELVGKDDGIVRATGFTWHVLMSQERRAVSIIGEIREMLSRP